MTRRDLALALYVPSFLVAFAQGVILPTMPIYATKFTASLSLVSFAVAALALGTLLSDVPSGMILDKLGRRPALDAGLQDAIVASIGPVCTKALQEFGIGVDIEAHPPKLGALMSALEEALA